MISIQTESRAGRQLKAMIEHGNRNAKMVLTVSVFDGNGTKRLHESFKLKAWTARGGERMVTFRTEHGNQVIGTMFPSGEFKPSRNTNPAPLHLYACKAILAFCTEGRIVQPTNGRVEIAERSFCGCCGRDLTHPDSIVLGIGPECEKRVTGKTTTRRGRTMRSKDRQDRPQLEVPVQPAREITDYERTSREMLALLEHDIVKHEALKRAAELRSDWDGAIRQDDILDSLRGERGQLRAEMTLNGLAV